MKPQKFGVGDKVSYENHEGEILHYDRNDKAYLFYSKTFNGHDGNAWTSKKKKGKHLGHMWWVLESNTTKFSLLKKHNTKTIELAKRLLK